MISRFAQTELDHFLARVVFKFPDYQGSFSRIIMCSKKDAAFRFKLSNLVAPALRAIVLVGGSQPLKIQIAISGK